MKTVAQKMVDGFDGDFTNSAIALHCVSLGGGAGYSKYAIFADGSAVKGDDRGVEEIPLWEAKRVFEQQ